MGRYGEDRDYDDGSDDDKAQDGLASDSWVHGLRRPGETLHAAKQRLEREGEAVRVEGRQLLFDRVRELTRRGVRRGEAARMLCLGHMRWKQRDLV